MASALPGPFPMAVYRGDTKQWTVTFDDGATPPVVIDMSDWTWLAQIRSNRDELDSVIATFDVDDTDAATGTIVLTLPADESAALVTVNGKATDYWDLQGTNDTVVKTWLAGKVTVTGDVSVSA